MKAQVEALAHTTVGSVTDDDLRTMRAELYQRITKGSLGPGLPEILDVFKAERAPTGIRLAFPVFATGEAEAWHEALKWVEHTLFAHPERRWAVSSIEIRVHRTPESAA